MYRNEVSVMKRRVLACIGMATILMVGCNQGDQTEGASSSEQKADVNAAGAEVLSEVYPLTGIATNEDINHRAISVTVNNHPAARPQSGLQKADFVYEMLAEGNVTRFLAVYQSEQPERVGPVRSARDYFVQIAEGLDSVYIAHGYSPEAKELLDEEYVDSLNGLAYDGTLFKRDSSRKAPHNSYISFENIEKGIEEKGYDLDGQPPSFSFLSEEEAQQLKGEDATNVTVEYGDSSYDVTYVFVHEDQVYERYTKGVQTVDADTGTSVALNNIIVLEAPHKVVDSEGRRDINLSNGGDAYLFQNGKMNQIQWQFVDNTITFMNDGKEVELIPGKTWVNVIPTNPGLQEKVQFE